jgi:TonB family protein
LRAIFVSYRRNDSQGEAGRLFDDLVTHFGEQKVFMDVAGIEAGRDFRKAIEESVANCGVLLVIMGPSWLTAKNEEGIRRLDDPADFVREEVAAALRRDIPVIPVLVRGAQMPRVEQLPATLKDLAYRNCVELTHARWRSDVLLLLEPLARIIGTSGEVKARSTSGEAIVAGHARRSSQELASSSGIEDISAARFDAATLQRIRRELAMHIGPIAEVVVSRAAPLCNSTDDLLLKLAEEIESPQQRQDFLRKMNATSLLDVPAPVTRESPTSIPQAPQKPSHKVDVDPVPVATPRSSVRSSSRVPVMVGAGFLVLVVALATAKWVHSPGTSSSAGKSQESPQEESKPEPNPETARPVDPVSLPESGTPAASPANGSASSERIRLPAEIASSLLVSKVIPTYPPLARRARIQGQVVLNVDISKEGTIESLRTITGHPMLIPAAIDAVKQWRYKPYLLNAEPVPVQTQVTVNFSFTSG